MTVKFRDFLAYQLLIKKLFKQGLHLNRGKTITDKCVLNEQKVVYVPA